ncbi:MAG TPA: LysM peptidoglycan-binding domain-containing protein [Longimicrobiales bacterium]|nr:LysM peptidoglycan-binding domain-containing protein [Longimicrobiales bacterium]
MLNRTVADTTRLALPALILALAAGPVAAQQPEPGQQQREHVVRRGDTLWDLARQYLSNPFLWPMIFEANRNVVENPHWIYPAERLIIPPVLQQEQPPFRQPEPIGHQPLPQVQPPPTDTAAGERTPTVLTTPDVRQPVLTEGEYVRLPWLSPAENPGATGRIQRQVDAEQAAARIEPALYPNQDVYVTVTSGTAAPGDTLMAVRSGRRVGTQGFVVEPLALLRVDSVNGGTVTARIVSQFGDARVGDVVMPVRPMPPVGEGEAEPVAGGPEGRILEFLEERSLYGTTDLAFVSLGRADGIGIGDEFAVYVPASGGIPASQVGTVRIVRVDERTATARVISVTGTTLRDGLPIRMVKRMP